MAKFNVLSANLTTNTFVNADRFILSAEQGAYLFLNDTKNGAKETVAVFSVGKVDGIVKMESK